MKKKYMTPVVETMDLNANGEICLFMTLSGGNTGLGSTKSATDAGITDADVNESGNWDIW